MITNKFKEWYKNHILLDIAKNYEKEIFHEGYYYNINTKDVSLDKKVKAYHVLFKFITNYPKNNNGIPLKLEDISNLKFIEFVDEIRYIMIENDFTLRVDEIEYYRSITKVNNLHRMQTFDFETESEFEMII